MEDINQYLKKVEDMIQAEKTKSQDIVEEPVIKIRKKPKKSIHQIFDLGFKK